MAVEIIFQCRDKDFWENIFIETDNENENKENICKVYDTLLEQLQKEMPDFKVANAVVHFDEASPHTHVRRKGSYPTRKWNLPKQRKI